MDVSPNKSMPPLETFVAYWLHLSLSSCSIEDSAFAGKEHLLYRNYIFSTYSFARLYTKKPKNTFYYYFLLNLLTNTFSSSWVWQPFLYRRVLQLISSTWESSDDQNIDMIFIMLTW
jgi:hypothetical protein